MTSLKEILLKSESPTSSKDWITMGNEMRAQPLLAKRLLRKWSKRWKHLPQTGETTVVFLWRLPEQLPGWLWENNPKCFWNCPKLRVVFNYLVFSVSSVFSYCPDSCKFFQEDFWGRFFKKVLHCLQNKRKTLFAWEYRHTNQLCYNSCRSFTMS